MEKLTNALTKVVGTYSRLRCVRAAQQHAAISTSSIASYKWEPDDLKLEPDIPVCPALNICMYGYDYAILENFAKYVFKAAKAQKLDVDRWAVPLKKMTVNTAKPKTKVFTDTFPLSQYQRVVQLQGIESISLPVFLEFIRQSIPEGVEIQVKEHQEEDDEFLFIPDLEKEKLVKQLKDLQDLTRKK